MTNTEKPIPAQAGIGLRSKHHSEILNTRPSIPWLEVHTENFFADGGSSTSFLEKIAALYPLSFHGVSLSIGSADGLNQNYLKKLKRVIDRFNPALVSEHLSWTSYNGIYTHDLLPIPYNKETLSLLHEHIDHVQNFLGRQILIENPSSYLEFRTSTMKEDEFLNEIASQTKCGILLDVNNIYVSGKNNNFDPFKYKIEKKHIKEIHLAGHTIVDTSTGGKMIIDTHSDFVCSDVWELYKHTIKDTGPVATLIEWDDKIPELPILLKEAEKAQDIINLYKDHNVSKKVTESIY